MSADQSGRQRYTAAAIAAELRSAIERGDYQPGAAIPGENHLMRDYTVARATARRAVEMLVNEGLVIPRKGAGVFVREFRPIIRNGIARLTSSTWSAGRSIWDEDIGNRELRVDQVQVGLEDPPDRVRVLLDLVDTEDRVIARRRRFVLDGKPVLLAVSWLPVSVAGGSQIEQEDTGPGGTYARLQELGYKPERFREDLRSRMPRADEAAALEMTPGTPVIEVTRTAYTAADQVVEVNEMTADAGVYVMRYEFGS